MARTPETGGAPSKWYRRAWFPAVPLVVLGVLLVLVAAAVASGWLDEGSTAPSRITSADVQAPTPDPTLPAPGTLVTRAPAESPPATSPPGDPLQVRIPAIGVKSDLIALRLNPDESMEVPPYGLSGWYALGPKPGAAGPAVIAAHVDSKKGPDVFFRLRELKPGDRVEVAYAGGRTVVFTVNQQEVVEKEALPVERIWNQTSEPVLRLVTCGGEFDRATGHYVSNVIVYASMVG